MRIGIGNDHSALELKAEIIEFLKEKGHEVVDFGTDSSESCDYPKYGEAVGRAVCSEPFTAKMSRAHNNCNVLAFGARVVGAELAKMIVDVWLNTEFEGGRHQRRVDMIMEIEER